MTERPWCAPSTAAADLVALNDVTGGDFDITLETFSEFLAGASDNVARAVAVLLNEAANTDQIAQAARELRAMYLQDAYTKRVIDGLADRYAKTL
jgi:hypothetical protein